MTSSARLTIAALTVLLIAPMMEPPAAVADSSEQLEIVDASHFVWSDSDYSFLSGSLVGDYVFLGGGSIPSLNGAIAGKTRPAEGAIEVCQAGTEYTDTGWERTRLDQPGVVAVGSDDRYAYALDSIGEYWLTAASPEPDVMLMRFDIAQFDCSGLENTPEPFGSAERAIENVGIPRRGVLPVFSVNATDTAVFFAAHTPNVINEPALFRVLSGATPDYRANNTSVPFGIAEVYAIAPGQDGEIYVVGRDGANVKLYRVVLNAGYAIPASAGGDVVMTEIADLGYSSGSGDAGFFVEGDRAFLVHNDGTNDVAVSVDLSGAPTAVQQLPSEVLGAVAGAAGGGYAYFTRAGRTTRIDAVTLADPLTIDVGGMAIVVDEDGQAIVAGAGYGPSSDKLGVSLIRGVTVPPAPTATAAPSWVVAPDGSAPSAPVGAALWQQQNGTQVPLRVSAPAPNQVRYEAEGMQLTLTGGPGTNASRGLVANASGEVECEICAFLAAGGVIESWVFSEPRLVSAWRIEDLPCQRFTIPVGAPLDGSGSVDAGAHTLHLTLPTATGMAALNVGITVGGPVPGSIPAGEGTTDSALFGWFVIGAALMAAVALLARRRALAALPDR